MSRRTSSPPARRPGKLLIGALAIGLALSPCLLGPTDSAAWFEESDVGARAISFGRAFTAIADDASALYWNPSGLAGMEKSEAQLSGARPFDISGLTEAYGVVALKHQWGTAALSWQHFGASGVASENTLSLGAGRVLHEFLPGVRLDAGAAVNLLRVSLAAYDDPATQERVDFGSATAVAADLGLMLRLPRGLNVGWNIQNLGGAHFDLVDGPGGSTKLPVRTRCGIAYRWNPESIVSVDFRKDPDERLVTSLAGEVWFYNSFAVRAGVSGNDAGGGVGIKARRWLFDFGFLTNEPLGLSYRAGFRVPL